MTGYIPEDKLEEIRAAADIVEIVSRYVPLTRAGGHFKGLCPFHAEKTPSFTVNPAKRIFHCFGCGVGGNIFRFLMLQKGISFPEAVAELAETYGLELPRSDGGRSRREKGWKTALYQTVALARQFFMDELNSDAGRPARGYLTQRGLTQEVIRGFHLGWAPAGWDNLRLYLESQRISPAMMEQAGLVRPRPEGRGCYDVFRARVITPINDLEGRPVAFGGRLIAPDDRQPKYLNSPETQIFNKGRLLYGLDRCRTVIKGRGTVLIVEGYFDLLSLAAHGVHHVVATLGTALTAAHLRLLKGYVHQAVLIFDADEAGRNAAARCLPLFLSADMEGLVLRLPEGHDPDTFVRAHGAKALDRALEESTGLMDFYLDQVLARHPRTLSGRSRAAQEVLSVIAQVEGSVRQDLLRRALAERLGVSEQALTLALRRQDQPEPGAERADAQARRINTNFETELIRMVLLHPEAAGLVFEAELESCFSDTDLQRVYYALAGQYRHLGRLDPDGLVDLPPEDQDLITGLALSDDGLGPDEVTAAAADYINKFSRRRRQNQVRDLSRRIKEAQTAGDVTGVEVLLKEKTRLLKEKTLSQ
ncbi:MAG: DNA primase [Thermodesulfobacteriota bacterium]